MEMFVILVLLTIILVWVIYSLTDRKKDKISFKEAMDLVELPVITFYNNDKKLNFLLDTGSNNSVINAPLVDNLEHTKGSCDIATIGMGGILNTAEVCNMRLTYNGRIFEDEFTIMDMSSQFDTVKQDSGVQLHGILGSKFFEKYRYVLDFSNLTAYTK